MALYNTCVGKHRQVPGNAMLRGEAFIYHADIHSLGGLKGTNVVALMVWHSTGNINNFGGTSNQVLKWNHLV